MVEFSPEVQREYVKIEAGKFIEDVRARIQQKQEGYGNARSYKNVAEAKQAEFQRQQRLAQDPEYKAATLAKQRIEGGDLKAALPFIDRELRDLDAKKLEIHREVRKRKEARDPEVAEYDMVMGELLKLNEGRDKMKSGSPEYKFQSSMIEAARKHLESTPHYSIFNARLKQIRDQRVKMESLKTNIGSVK